MNGKLHRAHKWTQIRNVSKSSGFSLFELVVFIICVAIIYATAARRFADFPADAERANFFAVTTQIQSGINLEMMLSITSGKTGYMSAFEGVNPMDLLLQAPSNYTGAFDLVDMSSMDRRTWYFDRSTRELVYLVNSSEGVYHINAGSRLPADEIRFAVRAQYHYRDRVTGLPIETAGVSGGADGAENLKSSISGVLMEPVIPFEWIERGRDLEAAAQVGL